jgi:HD-GYP domain-containing protein (c-di-GMP phosphodiesterase class II)
LLLTAADCADRDILFFDPRRETPMPTGHIRGHERPPVRTEAPGTCPGKIALTGLLEKMTAHRPDTAAHGVRVAVEAGRICRALVLSSDAQAVVVPAALFHDVGKAAVQTQRYLRRTSSFSCRSAALP